jgi:hypothetical protein
MSALVSELESINLGDQRLDKRARKVLQQLGSNPSASIPVACGGWSETKGAYRLLGHEDIDPQEILYPHYACSMERIKEHSVVLMLQDTTELDYTGKNDIQGMGPLNYETRRGCYLHPTLAVTPEKLCLGVMDAWIFAREPGSLGKYDTRSLPIEEKESLRWLEGYQRVCERQEELPDTKLVYVADREGDIFEIFAEHVWLRQQGSTPASWLIRARFNRKTNEPDKLWQSVEKTEPLGQIEFDVPASSKRKARHVTQTLRAYRTVLSPPYRKGKKLPQAEVTIVLAREESPPKGEKALEWFLVTSEEVENLDQAAQICQWYLCRWQIEIFFKVLKNGCKVERLQLEKCERIEVALSFYLIITWRILFLIALGKECPELPADAVFEKEEWQTAYLVAKRQQPPNEPPSLYEMICIIAGFGGFLKRKGDGFPGPQPLWIGLQRVLDFSFGIQAYQQAEKRCG